MATTTCPACRSINHEGISRCMNCGSPMELPAVPIDVDLDDLPAAVAAAVGIRLERDGAAGSEGPQRNVERRGRARTRCRPDVPHEHRDDRELGRSGAAIGAVAVLLTVSWAATGVFWLWMLIEAISNSRVGWALLIFFFGVIPAFCYALFGRTTRTASC